MSMPKSIAPKVKLSPPKLKQTISTTPPPSLQDVTSGQVLQPKNPTTNSLKGKGIPKGSPGCLAALIPKGS